MVHKNICYKKGVWGLKGWLVREASKEGRKMESGSINCKGRMALILI